MVTCQNQKYRTKKNQKLINNREFWKKHEIAEVKAQPQARVKVANLSRNTKRKCLKVLQIRGQAFRDDWYEIEPIYCCFFSRRISQHTRAYSQTSNLPPNPHIRTRHRSTAELRVVVIETNRTKSLTEEPSPESNDIAMSRLRTRETIISPCVGLAPSLNVCTSTRTKRNCCTAVLPYTAYTAVLP